MKPRSGTTVIVNWRDLSHPHAGGAEIYCEEIASRMARDGRRVVLLTSAVAGQPSSESRNGYRIVRRGGRFSVYPCALVWLLRHRRRIAMVVDSQCGIPFLTPLAVRRGTPVVPLIYHVHQEQFSQYFPPLLAQIGRWLEGPVSRLVYGQRTIVTISPSTRRGIRRLLRLQGAIQVAIPGCAPPEIEPGDIAGRSPTPRVVCVGRLVRHKRVHLLLESLPAVLDAHPGTELHIVGDGPERAPLEQLAAERNLRDNVVFHGGISSAERDAIVRSGWVVVNPSVAEGWGIVVIEANALGRPAVAFRVPGLCDSIRDGETGWLVEEGGQLGDRIADALDELVSVDAATRWSHRTVAWAARCDWDETTDIVDRALQAEGGRLARVNRREPTDLACHVFVPTSLVSADWKPSFRLTDRLHLGRNGLFVLLPGTDLRDAISALRRAGLPAGALADPRLKVRVARPSDFVDPTEGSESPVATQPRSPLLALVLDAADAES